MKTVEEIKAAIEAAVPGAGVKIVPNPSPSGQHSLLLDPVHAVEVAQFLRDDAELALDFLSNVTGVDYLDKEITEKVKVTRPVTKTVDGVEQTVEETVEETRKHIEPGYLEVVYHLYSMAKKHGPVVMRMRTVNRIGPGGAAIVDAGVAVGGVSGARGFRPVRDRVHGASGPAAPADVGWIQGSPHAPRLRGAGRL